ncbi:heterokaryon incompatibility protein-domain-containing protein [Scleroderma citrinum]
MRLVNVKAVLALAGDIADGHFKPEVKLLEERLGSDYAILSHCWGTDEEEVQFKEMDNLTTVDRATREKIMARSGYQKILKSCEQASAHNLDWLWVDTCCINKESSSELSEAINSMYPWYKRSKKCYAFLHDVEDPVFPRVSNEAVFSRDLNGWPRWFSRGWTLQELVAPNDVHFFNSSWVDIGNKKCLASTLEIITRIPTSILQDGLSAKPPSVAQVMSWAADRRTRRMEDKAYSLLGLLDVHMPMLYGEGKKAFRRLQVEVLRTYNDHTIFAWGHSRKTGWSSSFLADDPSQFRDCSSIVTDSGNSERLETFSVSNAGIQIWLPIKSCHVATLQGSAVVLQLPKITSSNHLLGAI